MDDWDSVSDTTPSNSAADPSDAVSTPQPQRRKGGQAIELSLSRHFVLLGLAGLVIASLASGITWFVIYRVSGNSIATTATGTEAITNTDINATATAQAVATATTLQQIYTQATGKTPTIDDPLSDNRNGWSTFNASWGACGFTGGAYHFTLSSGGLWNFCNCVSTQNLNNFALQVQVNIVKGNDGGIVFGSTANSYYRIYVDSEGTYILYQYTKTNDQTQTLRSASSPAITTGLNQANVMTVIVNNNNFYFYANNQFVMSSYLNVYSAGAVSLTAASTDQATDVEFSNLKVWTF